MRTIMSRPKKYTNAQIDFLREGYRKMKVEDLTKAFNDRFNDSRTFDAIRTILARRGFKCGRAHGQRLIKHYRVLSREQLQFLREWYPKCFIPELTERLNAEFGTAFKTNQVVAAISNNRIKSGRDMGFKPGNKPWNAGTKGQRLTKPNSGSFQKGNRPIGPKAPKPFGYERTGKGYKFVKTHGKNPHTGYNGAFRLKHIVLWEKHHGPVPDGHVIIFKDSNRDNITIENLECISRLELLRLNKREYSKMPDEIKHVVLTIARLEAKVITRQGTPPVSVAENNGT